MTPNTSNRTRPSRYRVPNNEQVLCKVENERFAGTLTVLSLTGGTMRTVKRLRAGTFADIKLTTASGPVGAVIEFLSSRGDNQAFRFVQIDNESKKKLQKSLETMESHGLGDKKADPLDHVIRFARKIMRSS